MKKHFEYIGYGRSGSTYLYSLLKNHSYFSEMCKKLPKENMMLHNGYAFDEYKKIYNDYQYSFNMCPITQFLNSSQLKELNEYTDKFFMVIRNPYDFIISVIKFNNLKNYPTKFALNNSLDYVRLIDRIKQNINKPLEIIIFDDLINNTEFVLKKLLDFLELPYESLIKGDEFRNSSKKYRYNSLTRSVDEVQPGAFLLDMAPIKHITEINSQIDQLTQYLNRDFSSWKR